jgi:hypothetical protein
VTVRVGGGGQIVVGPGVHKGLDVVAVPTGTDPLVADDFPEPPHAARTNRAGSSSRTIRSRPRFMLASLSPRRALLRGHSGTLAQASSPPLGGLLLGGGASR